MKSVECSFTHWIFFLLPTNRKFPAFWWRELWRWWSLPAARALVLPSCAVLNTRQIATHLWWVEDVHHVTSRPFFLSSKCIFPPVTPKSFSSSKFNSDLWVPLSTDRFWARACCQKPFSMTTKWYVWTGIRRAMLPDGDMMTACSQHKLSPVWRSSFRHLTILCTKRLCSQALSTLCLMGVSTGCFNKIMQTE